MVAKLLPASVDWLAVNFHSGSITNSLFSLTCNTSQKGVEGGRGRLPTGVVAKSPEPPLGTGIGVKTPSIVPGAPALSLQRLAVKVWGMPSGLFSFSVAPVMIVGVA